MSNQIELLCGCGKPLSLIPGLCRISDSVGIRVQCFCDECANKYFRMGYEHGHSDSQNGKDSIFLKPKPGVISQEVSKRVTDV